MDATHTTQERQARIAAARERMARLAAPETAPLVALGAAGIDACLGGGLKPGALHEVQAADHRALPAALGFLLALTLAVKRTGPILWPLERGMGEFGTPYGPGLKSFGLDPAGIVFVRCRRREDVLWAMEEGLRLGGIGAVAGMRASRMDLTQSRRLQLAAEEAGIPILLLRDHKDGAASAAATRWRVSPQAAATEQIGGQNFLSHPRWHVALERVRAGRPGEWVVEWNHDALCLRLPAAVRGGALPAERRHSAA